MDRRFIIIHNSEIIRKGLWAILRETFHNEFVLLKEVSEIADYSGFLNMELYIFLQSQPSNASSKSLISKMLNESNAIMYIELNADEPSDDFKNISLNESSAEIVKKVKHLSDKSGDNTSAMSDLSEREKDVLIQVALGLTNKEIAEKLFISIHTVITHRKHITEKLGIKSIPGLTVYAILNKLIDTENIDPSTLI